jgi:hypothetical protein
MTHFWGIDNSFVILYTIHMDDKTFSKLMTAMIQNIKSDPVGDAIQEERARIIGAINRMEEASHSTRTPIYQDTFFEQVKAIVYDIHPPYQFRDKAEGE